MTGQLSLPERLRILGLPVSAIDLDGAVALAVQAISAPAPLRIVVTNHNKCWLAHRDARLRDFMEAAECVVAETSAAWAARVLGRPGVGPAWGVVLMDRLLDEATQRGWRVFLLGARPPVVQRLQAVLRDDRGVDVCGYHHGYLDASSDAEVRRQLGELRPDLLLTAMGSPRQEHFMASLTMGEGPTVVLGVGGSFDVHAGLKPDAPRWVRNSGLEWLYRTAVTPRLLRRYARVLPWFLGAVARERLTGRHPGPPS